MFIVKLINLAERSLVQHPSNVNKIQILSNNFGSSIRNSLLNTIFTFSLCRPVSLQMGYKCFDNIYKCIPYTIIMAKKYMIFNNFAYPE